MRLYPRHNKIIDFLTEHAPNLFSVEEISDRCSISLNTLKNEITSLVEADYLRRIRKNKRYHYFVGIPSSSETSTAPLVLDRVAVGSEIDALRDFDYAPVGASLAWNYPLALSEILNATVACRKPTNHLLLELLDYATKTATWLRALLDLEDLWQKPGWLAQGLSEAQLKNLEELSRQLTERYAKLNPSAHQAQTTT